MKPDTTTQPRITGRVVWRDDPGYEEVRRAAVWNARKPQRYPDVIVVAASDQDVATAVRYARSQQLKVAVRSGGHSMCGSSLHNSGMLIDLSCLDGISIDVDARTAVVQPAVTSAALAHALGEHGLAFSVGHCGTVPMGGYLLAGGLGLNMGTWGGPACASMQTIEVITADGEFVIADQDHNPDLYWAARGGGPGFFGVVTRFHLRVYLLPAAIRSSTYVYPLAVVEEVGAWAASVLPALSPKVEMLLHLASAPPGAPAGPAGKVVAMSVTAFADSAEEAAEVLSLLESCPAVGRALVREVARPTSIKGLHDSLAIRLPEAHRYIEHSWWSNEDYAAVLPRLAEEMVGAPSPKSVVMTTMLPAPPEAAHPLDTAFSPLGRTFILAYAIWEDESDDARNESWHRQLTESIDRLGCGHYIAEADLTKDPSRAARSYTPTAWEKLHTLRRTHDPGDVFYSFLGL